MRWYLDVDLSLMPPLLLRLSRTLHRPIMPGTVRMHDGGERYIEIRLSCKGEASKVATNFDCIISCQTYTIENNRVKDPGYMAFHRHREGRHEMRDCLCRHWFEPEPDEPLCCDDEMFDIKATLSLEEADEAFFEAWGRQHGTSWPRVVGADGEDWLHEGLWHLCAAFEDAECRIRRDDRECDDKLSELFWELNGTPTWTRNGSRMHRTVTDTAAATAAAAAIAAADATASPLATLTAAAAAAAAATAAAEPPQAAL